MPIGMPLTWWKTLPPKEKKVLESTQSKRPPRRLDAMAVADAAATHAAAVVADPIVATAMEAAHWIRCPPQHRHSSVHCTAVVAPRSTIGARPTVPSCCWCGAGAAAPPAAVATCWCGADVAPPATVAPSALAYHASWACHASRSCSSNQPTHACRASRCSSTWSTRAWGR